MSKKDRYKERRKMEKIKLGVLFGGMSTEHDVSIVSGSSVIKNLNKEKYEIYPIYIDRQGKWYRCYEEIEKLETLKVGDPIEKIKKIEDVMDYLSQMDCLFPVLHGLYGEDGTIQGLFELLKKPYVGCKVLASSLCMDKAYTKIILEKADIPQAPYVSLRMVKEKTWILQEDLSQKQATLEEIITQIENKQTYPMFVKPSNSGSSVGIQKAKKAEELKQAILYAAQYDTKIVVEQGIIGKEVECAVLGNEEVITSCIGEVLSAEEFYTYESKYHNNQSRTKIPAELPEEVTKQIQSLAKKAFQAVDGKGLARIDFFVEDTSNKVILNEINTMPGFTQISMYPKLFEADGITYCNLLDKLIALAM